jgi:hypothetical protein
MCVLRSHSFRCGESAGADNIGPIRTVRQAANNLTFGQLRTGSCAHRRCCAGPDPAEQQLGTTQVGLEHPGTAPTAVCNRKLSEVRNPAGEATAEHGPALGFSSWATGRSLEIHAVFPDLDYEIRRLRNY